MQAKDIVLKFLTEVRSGAHLERASRYMADIILAHQFNAENPQTIHRSPADYAAHIEEFRSIFGDFKFEILELISQDDKIHVRWMQQGIHTGKLDGFEATGLPLVEYSSAVYRVRDNKICEYWIQTDRMGCRSNWEKIEISKVVIW